MTNRSTKTKPKTLEELNHDMRGWTFRIAKCRGGYKLFMQFWEGDFVDWIPYPSLTPFRTAQDAFDFFFSKLGTGDGDGMPLHHEAIDHWRATHPRYRRPPYDRFRFEDLAVKTATDAYFAEHPEMKKYHG